MADQKISQLSDGGNSQATDEYVIARSGANYRIDGASVAAAATSVGTLTSLTVSGDLTVDTSTLKVDSTNNTVGIGTATPGTTYQLTVRRDGADTGVRIGNNTTYDQFIYFNGNNDWSMGMDYSNSNAFVISNSSTIGTNDRVVLTTSGNLGLGVTPSAPLHVKAANNEILRLQSSDTTTGGIYFSFYDSADAEKAYIGYGSTITDVFSFVQRENAAMVFFTNATERAAITAGGDVQIRTADSYFYSNATSGGTTIDCGFQFISSTKNLAFWANNAERARIDSSGNLGVGITPTARLHVSNTTGGSTAANYVNIAGSTADNSNYPGIQLTGGTLATTYPTITLSNGGLALSIAKGYSNSNQGRADISMNDPGVIQLNTSSSGAALKRWEVANNGKLTNDNYTIADYTVAINNASTQGYGYYISVNNDGTAYTYFDGYSASAAAYRVRIFSNGNIQNTNNSYGTLASERRFKQDIVDAPSQWDDIKNIRLRKFRMKDDVVRLGDEALVHMGVIIDELEQVSPGLVEENKVFEMKQVEVEVTKTRPVLDADGNDTGEVEEYTETETQTEQVLVDTVKGWKSSILYMKAVKALQEAMARIEALEARLEALEA